MQRLQGLAHSYSSRSPGGPIGGSPSPGPCSRADAVTELYPGIISAIADEARTA